MHNCFLHTAILSPGGFMKLRMDLNTSFKLREVEITQDVCIDKDFLNRTLFA